MTRLTISIASTAAAVLLVCSSGCDRTPPAQNTSTAASTTSTPSTSTVGQIAAPDDTGDWIRPAKDFASTRFSSLDQITPDTVKQLGVKFTFSTGVNAGHEAAPIV